MNKPGNLSTQILKLLKFNRYLAEEQKPQIWCARPFFHVQLFPFRGTKGPKSSP